MSATSTALDVLRLHYVRRKLMFGMPVFTIILTLLISGVITFIFYRLGSTPGSAEWIQGSRSNPAMLWALGGFFGYLGVQSVATTFPFALSLGSTRRNFSLGTLLSHVLTAAYAALLLLAALGLEKLTNQWFSHAYLVDVYILGGGDPVRLVAIVFLGVLTVLSLGGVFGAAHVRFGTRGPLLLGAGLVIILGLLAGILLPILLESGLFTLGWLAAAAGITIVLACIGNYVLLRSASVR
ncbi:hypothetical protein [Mycetocola spongiae]|uniref:hypothetical protein n=1 Tax=Mycetocola spongiae TaxID=2859226 RepID=UPI001CF48569|nr:hypothetical protein [Mycetocola spongiae]UCR89800.1 hypothetical protein KXZ72_03750 [Mycetocola spongiae]